MTATARRGHGEGSVYRDAANGTWVGAISLGWTDHPGPDGRLLRGRRGALVSDPAAPFGGVMQPGLGREGEYEGLLGTPGVAGQSDCDFRSTLAG